MTTYKYKGLSPDGAKLSGVIKAYNEFEAVAQLRETCSVITKIEEVKETQSWNKQIGTKKIKDKELAIICSQFTWFLAQPRETNATRYCKIGSLPFIPVVGPARRGRR